MFLSFQLHIQCLHINSFDLVKVGDLWNNPPPSLRASFLAYPWSIQQQFLTITVHQIINAWATPPRDSDLLGLGQCLGKILFKSSPDDFNVQPRVRDTACKYFRLAFDLSIVDEIFRCFLILLKGKTNLPYQVLSSHPLGPLSLEASKKQYVKRSYGERLS